MASELALWPSNDQIISGSRVVAQIDTLYIVMNPSRGDSCSLSQAPTNSASFFDDDGLVLPEKFVVLDQKLAVDYDALDVVTST